MIKCNNCGHDNPDYSIYCQQCNSLLSSIDSDGGYKSAETKEQVSSGSSSDYVKVPASTGSGEQSEARTEEPPKIDRGSAVPNEVYTPDQGEYKYTGPAGKIPDPDPQNELEVNCLIGFWISLSSIFCLGATSIIGLIVSITGLVKAGNSGKSGSMFAIIGIILSGIMLAVFIGVLLLSDLFITVFG